MDLLRAVQVFVETVDRGSLTAAADALEMSRAMASRHLDAVEQWLGARVLHRTTRRLSLTDAGEEALIRCRQMVELAQDARDVAGQHIQQVRGRLRVSVSTSFAHHHLAEAVSVFLQERPLARIELLAMDQIVNLVEDRIDLAIRITNELDPALVARRLTWCRSVLCAAPSYLDRAGEPRSAAELAAHACVGHSYFGRDRWTLRHGSTGETEIVQPDVRIRSNVTDVLLSAVLAGAGIGLLPTFLVGTAVREGRLRRVLPGHEIERLGLHAVYVSRRHQPLILRSFVDFLAQRFDPEQPYWEI